MLHKAAKIHEKVLPLVASCLSSGLPRHRYALVRRVRSALPMGCLAASIAFPSAPLRAQTSASLPAQATPQTKLPVAADRATLEGTVEDPSGAMIPGAKVEVTPAAGGPALTVTTDEQGHYTLHDLAAGSYTVFVISGGFESNSSIPFDLHPGEVQTLPAITLKVPVNRADAYVTMNREQIAEAEVHAAEQQRVLGFPDFYTSFVWNAAPLNSRQKLSLGLHATTDRMSFVTAGLVASGEQVLNSFPDFGGGWAGFGKRYGAAYADAFTGKIIGGALLPSVFRQDPRYFYMGPNGTLKQRVRHAVASAFLVRGDNGKTEVNYSHILGNASAGALSTLYHPASNSPGKLALNNALLGTLGEAGVNLVRELVLKRFVRGGDVDSNGMPKSEPNPPASRTIQ